jgi:YVTN family beta-propeller protein
VTRLSPILRVWRTTGRELTPIVTPIDTATNHAGTPINVGAGPNGIAITPDGRTAYVANFDSDTVTLIDTATNTPATTLTGFDRPSAIAITPDGSTAYVANWLTGTVTPVRTATNRRRTPIPVGAEPYDIAVTPDGTTAYVSNLDANTVTPFDVATGTPSAPIPVGAFAHQIAITPDQAPRAVFTASPAPAGSVTRFDASASIGRSSPVASYHWAFGDGTSVTAHRSRIAHTYMTAGTYRVTLIVTDAAGTSTKQVFTGRTMSRNGGPSARSTSTIAIT